MQLTSGVAKSFHMEEEPENLWSVYDYNGYPFRYIAVGGKPSTSPPNSTVLSGECIIVIIPTNVHGCQQNLNYSKAIVSGASKRANV